MNIIEEIEADTAETTSEFVASDWWPRIRAALEAAQKFETFARQCHEPYYGVHGKGFGCSVCDGLRKFREAMNEPNRRD